VCIFGTEFCFAVEEHCSLSGSPVTFAMLSLYILFIQ